MGLKNDVALLEDRAKGWFDMIIQRLTSSERREAQILDKLNQMLLMINNVDKCTDKMKASIEVLAHNAAEHPAHCFFCGRPLGADNSILYETCGDIIDFVCTDCAKSKEHDRRKADKK